MAKRTATLTLEDLPAKPLIKTELPGGKVEEKDDDAPAALSLLTKVETKQGTFTIQELLEAKIQGAEKDQQLAALNEYRQHVATLSNPAVKDPNVRAQSLRYVLSADGVAPEVIE